LPRDWLHRHWPDKQVGHTNSQDHSDDREALVYDAISPQH
jgi:hypothetical protein